MHPILHILYIDHIIVPIYTHNNTHPILRIKVCIPMYTCWSYASHTTYQGTYTDIYMCIIRVPYHVSRHIYQMQNAMQKLMRSSAKLSRGRVKPYGVTVLQVSQPPRLILMQQCDACTNSWQSVAISSNHAMMQCMRNHPTESCHELVVHNKSNAYPNADVI
jgi:hypothetical protein